MGWWSADVLGGDTPWDFIGNYARICGVPDAVDDCDMPLSYPITRALLEANMDRCVDAAVKHHDSGIGFQVLGYLILCTGAKANKQLVSLIVRAAEDDAWAKTDKDRANYMRQLIAVFTNRKAGKCVTLGVLTLADKMSQKAPAKLSLVKMKDPDQTGRAYVTAVMQWAISNCLYQVRHSKDIREAVARIKALDAAELVADLTQEER